MKLKIGTLEITVHRKGRRPHWTKENPPITYKEEKRLARAVLCQACAIYGVNPDNLSTGSREGELPSTRKIISATLNELGWTSDKIYKHLGSSVGVPATVRHQLLSIRTLSKRTHPKLYGALDEMREVFILS